MTLYVQLSYHISQPIKWGVVIPKNKPHKHPPPIIVLGSYFLYRYHCENPVATLTIVPGVCASGLSQSALPTLGQNHRKPAVKYFMSRIIFIKYRK